MQPTVLLIDWNGKRARATARILSATGAEVEHCKLDALDDVGTDSALAVVFLDQSERVDNERVCCTLAARQQPLILCTESVRAKDLATLFNEFKLPHVIATQHECTDLDLFVTVRKLLASDIFGGDKYFTWGSHRSSRTLSGSVDVPLTVTWAESFAAEMKVPVRLAEMFISTIEELVSNALYDAPTDPSGRYLFADMSRALPITLPADKKIECELLCDGKRIGVSVADPFGSLELGRVSSRLVRCLERGAEQIEQKAGGAGMGLFFTLANASHLIVNACPGTRTEVVAILDLHDSFRDFAQRGKSLNIFTQTASQLRQESLISEVDK